MKCDGTLPESLFLFIEQQTSYKNKRSILIAGTQVQPDSEQDLLKQQHFPFPFSFSFFVFKQDKFLAVATLSCLMISTQHIPVLEKVYVGFQLSKLK